MELFSCQEQKIYRCYAYGRLSKRDRENGARRNDESNSIKNQRALIHDYISRCPDLELCMEGYDDDYTGTNFERPGIQALFAAVRRGEVKCIIVKDLSRFSRDSLEGGEYLERIFPLLQVRFIAVNDGFDSWKCRYGAAGDLDVGVRSLLNELYSVDISRKGKLAKRQCAERGEYIAPYPFYGYAKSPENRRRLVIDPEAAGIVREIFSLWLDRHSTFDIALILNGRNVPSPSHYKRLHGAKRQKWSTAREVVPWKSDSVWNILRNEQYTGTQISQRFARRELGKANSHITPREYWVVTPNAFEAIIDKETFQRAQDLFPTGRTHQRRRYPPALFAKKLTCKTCGRSLDYMRCIRPYYSCRAEGANDGALCNQTRVYEDVLKKAVLEALHRLTDEMRETDQDSVCESVALPVRLKRLEQRIEKLWTEKKDAFVRLAQGLLEQNAYEALCAGKQEEISRLRQEMERLCAGQAETSRVGQEMAPLLQERAELTREHVERLVKRILVSEDGQFEIEWTPHLGAVQEISSTGK